MTVWTKLFFLLKLVQSQAHLDIVFLWLAHLNTELFLHSTSSKHHSFCSLLRSLERKIEYKQKIFRNHRWIVAGLHHTVVDVYHNYTNHLLLEYLVSYHTALRQPRLSVQPFSTGSPVSIRDGSTFKCQPIWLKIPVMVISLLGLSPYVWVGCHSTCRVSRLVSSQGAGLQHPAVPTYCAFKVEIKTRGLHVRPKLNGKWGHRHIKQWLFSLVSLFRWYIFLASLQ